MLPVPYTTPLDTVTTLVTTDSCDGYLPVATVVPIHYWYVIIIYVPVYRTVLNGTQRHNVPPTTALLGLK